MSIRLTPEDCHAIDLLLDQGARAADDRFGRSVTSSASSIGPDHLVAVQRVLGLLDLMPAPQPPADLVRKTLARIESAPRSANAAADISAMPIHRGLPSA